MTTASEIQESAQDRNHDPDIVTWIRRGTDCDVPPTPMDDDAQFKQGLTVAVCAYQRADSLVRFLDSLPDQELKPQRLLIIDASPDDETEEAFRHYARTEELAEDVIYFRVRGAYQTLTCSRNFTLQWVETDLFVFFDDDVVLQPGCLQEMVKPHRELGDEVVGVGGFATNYCKSPPLFWRVRKLLRIVPHLEPGRFPRSGIATPWSFLKPTDEWVEGDWLSGCSMMWKTAVAKKVRFNEGFGGHSTGEDVDFSLRMGRHGKLLVAGKAHLLHLMARGGRPNTYRMGYTGVRNSYDIHRRCLKNRTWRDGLWFAYAYGCDAMMRTANLLSSGDRLRRLGFLRGRLRFLTEIVSGKFQLSQAPEDS